MLQPCNGSLYPPAAPIPTKRTTVLGLVFRSPIGTMKSDHFNAMFRDGRVERIAVVGLVADDSRGRLIWKHEIEHLLNTVAFVTISRSGINGYRQASGIDQDHYFQTFTDLGDADAVATSFGLGEGSIDEALIEPIATALLNAATGVSHNVLEDAVFDPLLEPSMNSALRSESSRQILPLGTVIENPEDPGNDAAFVGRRSTSERTPACIGNAFADPIELFVCEGQHGRRHSNRSTRFWDSFYTALVRYVCALSNEESKLQFDGDGRMPFCNHIVAPIEVER